MKDIFEEMKRMHQEMDRLFSQVFSSPKLLHSKDLVAKRPETDLQETEKEIIATFDLPGVEKGEIQLHVDKDLISVKAEKKHEVETKKENYLHQERSYSCFHRSFALPAEIKPEEAEAEYRNGVLTVRMPKKVIEKKERKRIEVKIK